MNVGARSRPNEQHTHYERHTQEVLSRDTFIDAYSNIDASLEYVWLIRIDVGVRVAHSHRCWSTCGSFASMLEYAADRRSKTHRMNATPHTHTHTHTHNKCSGAMNASMHCVCVCVWCAFNVGAPSACGALVGLPIHRMLIIVIGCSTFIVSSTFIGCSS